MLRSTLLPHQLIGVDWCLEREAAGCILADDMGLGKTVTACGVMVQKRLKTLVVAPIALLGQWKAEVEKHTDGVRAMVYHGSKVESFAEFDVIITNPETILSNFKKGRRAIFDVFDRLIVDEAHGFRNAKSRVFEATYSIFGQRTDMRKILMTGTPICNKSRDMIALVSLLNIPELSDPDYWKAIKGADEEVEALRTLRREHVLRRTKEEVIGDRLPKKEIRDVRINLEDSPVYTSQYKRIQQRVEKPVIKKILRLRQCVNNVAFTREATDTSELSNEISAKVRYIRETVMNVPEGEKIVIFSQWTTMLAHIALEIGEDKCELFHGKMGGVEKRRALERFNDDSGVKVFLVSLKCGGCGLNLVAANHVIMTEPYFNLAEEKQAIDRVYRIGQTRDVIIHKLFVPGTIESWMHQLQKIKGTISDAVLGDVDGATVKDELRVKNEMFHALVQ